MKEYHCDHCGRTVYQIMSFGEKTYCCRCVNMLVVKGARSKEERSYRFTADLYIHTKDERLARIELEAFTKEQLLSEFSMTPMES